DRGLHEPALAADRRRPAAVHYPSAFALPLLHITEHGFPLLPGDQGAELRPGIEGIAGSQPLGARHQPLDELAMHRFLDEQARAGGADLTLAVEDAVVGALDRGVQVRVREDD